MKSRIAACLIVGSILLFTACGGPGSGPDGETVALEDCQDKILDQLKSPKSAEFTEMESVNMSAAIAELASKSPAPNEPGKEILYTVTGNVDSDNPMGVSIRSGILCMVKIKDGDIVESTASFTNR